MKKCIAILFLIGIWFSVGSYSQSPPQPSATKKRGLDQFDINNGVRVDKPESKVTAPTDRFTVVRPSPQAEQVDKSTYEGVKRMVQEAFAIKEGYLSLFDPGGHFSIEEGDRASASRDGGPSARSPHERVLARKLTSLNRIIELYRVGLLDQKPLQDRHNVDLLTENQRVISNIMRALDVIRREQFDCEVYEVKPLCSLYYRGYVPHGGPYEKKVLITAMLTELKNNFQELQTNVVHNR